MARAPESKPPTKLGEMLKTARLEKGWTQTQLAERAGTNQSTIDRIERSQTIHSRALSSIIRALDLDEENALAAVTQDAAASAEEAVANLRDQRLQSSIKTMPLYAAVEGGVGGMIVDKDALSYIPVPYYLSGFEGAYAVYISGESMMPEYEPGDIAHVNPRMPAIPNTTCIFYTHNTENDLALIKRLEKISPQSWHVRQWNPNSGDPAAFELDRTEWPECHRVVGRVPRS